jgi:hypothetical protein
MEIKKIKEKDLHLPPAPAMAPQIDWGKDFLEWDPEQQNRYLRRLCSALNQASDTIQKERNALLVDMHKMKDCVENADKAVAIQKAIVLKAITDHNAQKQELIKQLQELELKIKIQDNIIKGMENGDNGRLDN